MKKRTGGYDNYSLKGSTLVEGYVPGPQRTNLRGSPGEIIGRFDPGTFGQDELIEKGPGSIIMAIPDASRFSRHVMPEPFRPSVYKTFAIDDRQIAGYAVSQLKNNPLSIFSRNPTGKIPGFECDSKPDDYSDSVSELKVQTAVVPTFDFSQQVYPNLSGLRTNPNLDIVYNKNMGLDPKILENPMIALGSSRKVNQAYSYSGKCYSGTYN